MATADQLRRRAQQRKFMIQAVVVAVIFLSIWSAVSSAQTNLTALGITSGFGFLERATGWGYSFSLIERSIDDTYARTLTIGFLNTLFLGTLCIVLSTIVGFLVGSIRDSTNLALQTLSTTFIQFFRNIPLILQVVFWYALLIHMPGPRQAMSLVDMVFLSNRGLMVPMFNLPVTAALGVGLASAAIAALLFWMRISLAKAVILWLVGTALSIAVACFALIPAGEPIVSIPALKGLRFRGGLELSIELLAMIIAIVLYSSAYIAEVVRGGLAEVPRGLTEAGQALGMSSRAIWLQIRLPMALRSIIPPLGNQWIFVMKATTVGVAIGFSDLFMIVSTSITQSGQTLELIAILMGAFLLVNFTLAQLVNLLNARLQLKGH
ncbi:MAG: ABC transporter permease subunit [Pseudomonadota bacterium]